MFTERLRKLGYGWMVVQGLLTAVAPRLSIALNVRLWGFPFENAGDLEPRDWYVRAARAGGVGMVAAGGIGLLLDDRAGTGEDEDEGGTGDDDDGPIEVSPDGDADA